MRNTKTDNRTQGGRFEQDMARILSDHGFWVHVMQQNKAGQPADLIAIKGKYHTLIDCKVISDDKGFPFERVEENQRYAMRMFHKKCREMCYFALRTLDCDIHLISLERIEILRMQGLKRLNQRGIQEQAWPLEKWLDASETWAVDL